MFIEWISELIDNINHHGVRWGLVFAFYAIYRKERRNYRLDRRDEVHNAYFSAILANQRIIIEKMGVGGSWDGTLKTYEKTDHRSLKPSFIGYYEVILKNLFQFPRRKKKMNTQNINWATLVPCLLGAVKLILQPMGINIPDQNLNEIANGIAALATVIGIIYSHRKGEPANGLPQPTNTLTNNK